MSWEKNGSRFLKIGNSLFLLWLIASLAQAEIVQTLVITKAELQEFGRLQPRPLSPKDLQTNYVRIKLFALEAVKEGLVDASPADLKGLLQAAELYAKHVCQSWQPSEEAIKSFYLTHRRRFSSCAGETVPLEEARAQIVKILQNAACKKLLVEKEALLKKQTKIVFEN